MDKKSKNTKIERVDRAAGDARVIEVSFHPEDSDRVLSLLLRFGGCSGEVTTEEAATKLASMAMFLGNIASGHTRARADGMDCDLGMDFLVEGGMASADFVSSVIAHASWIQERLERNLLHDPVPETKGQRVNKTIVEARAKQYNFDSVMLPKHKAQMKYTRCMEEFMHQSNASKDAATLSKGELAANIPSIELMPEDRVSALLIRERRATLLREATEFPFFLLKMSGMASLPKRAARAHLGHLMVHTRVESPACLEKLRRGVSEIGEGSLSGRSEGSPTVRVNQALCANSKVLEQAVAAARSQPGKVSGLLWLVEASPGCELPAETAASHAPDFRNVCELEIMRRINFGDGDVHELDALDGLLAGWRKFLREQDRHLPGIATTAWNLPVALCYGLEAMLKHRSKMDGAEVISLAEWLVLRMCNRFAAAAPGSHIEGMRRLAEKLVGKLLDHGPMSVRDLTRRCSKLKKDDCLRVLGCLSEQGVVACEGRVWGIVCGDDVLLEQNG